MAKPTARDMEQMLRNHYIAPNKPAGGVFAREIESPEGRRRADAIWAPFHGGIVGHEIKVSRGDLISELDDPTKAVPWMKFCDRWWLVVPDPKLIDGLEIPETWGVMSPPSGRRRRTATVVVEAPRLKPGDTGAAWRRLLSWHHNRVASELASARMTADYAQKGEERLRKQIQDMQANAEVSRDPRAALVMEVLDHVSAQQGARHLDRDLPWSTHTPSAEDIATALVDLDLLRATARNLKRDLTYQADAAQRLLNPIERFSREMKAIAKRIPGRGDL